MQNNHIYYIKRFIFLYINEKVLKKVKNEMVI